ncbi:MAG TPA: DNRLRE domain-containing protein [Planctomycetota bacterium]|jgi:hypothetical protein
MNSEEITVTASGLLPANPSGTPGASGNAAPQIIAPGVDPADFASPLALPLRTRIALWILLATALAALALIWARYGQRITQVLHNQEPETAGQKEAGGGRREAGNSLTGRRGDGGTGGNGRMPEAGKRSDGETGGRGNGGKREEARTAIPPAAIPALAELEVLAALAEDDPTFDLRAGTARVRPHLTSPEESVRAAAARLLLSLQADLNARARSQARAVAEAALDSVNAGDFPAAQQSLQTAIGSLQPDVPWVQEHGRKQLQTLLESILSRRAAEQSRIVREFAEAWRGKDPVAKAKAEQWLQHRDPELRAVVNAIRSKIDDETRTAQAAFQHKTVDQRNRWLDFFSKLTLTLGEGDLENAQRVCDVPAGDPMLGGGVADPNKVLEGCRGDIAAIKKLQDAALIKAQKSKHSVSLVMRRGRVEGVLNGAEGRQINLLLPGGGNVGVKVENLTAACMAVIFEQKDLQEPALAQAMWALNAYERSNEAALTLPRTYAAAKLPVPLHWTERFKLEKWRQLDGELGRKLKDLAATIKGGDAEKIAEALAGVRPTIKSFEEIEPLSGERQEIIAAAEKFVGKAARKNVVMQNGVSPAAEYAGINTDQISQYRDSMRKTDVGVQFGLKLGASGGLHRILIRFDGLEAALGKATVKKATLEMYQIESPQSPGSEIALFRIKRTWVPDAGTWVSFNSGGKDCDWAAPGASDEKDCDVAALTTITLDGKKNLWRAFDVTAYVQEILSGKAPNHGLLMKVANGEPDHHVRFYPETDLQAIKDKTLRPKITLEVEGN